MADASGSSSDGEAPAKKARGSAASGFGSGFGTEVVSASASSLIGPMPNPNAGMSFGSNSLMSGISMSGMPGLPGMTEPGGPGTNAGMVKGLAGLGPEPKVATSLMDFKSLNQSMVETSIVVQDQLVPVLMTPELREVLGQESGATVEWAPEKRKVRLGGSMEQINRAKKLLARVMMHTRWGCNPEKVRRLLRPRRLDSVKVQLSPMERLKAGTKVLTPAKPTMFIGKDKKCDVRIHDALCSRIHCQLKLDEERGAVYATDLSTNGTYLNGLRLPSKKVGKVMVWHGDEILLKDPASGEQEFGYIVNIKELAIEEEKTLEKPRRMLTEEEKSSLGWV